MESVVADLLKRECGFEGYGAQNRLAEHLGVPRQKVSNWVKGVGSPPRELWPQIEKFFGLDYGSIATEIAVALGADPTILSRVHALEEEVADLRKLTSEIGKIVRDLVQAQDDRTV